MISPKQKILNDMIDAIVNYTQQNDLECLLIATVPVDSNQGDIITKVAANCKSKTAHYFGHAIVELNEQDGKRASEISRQILSGIACTLIGETLQQILNSPQSGETFH